MAFPAVFVAFLGLLLLGTSQAHADCVELPRKVTLEKGSSVALKNFACRTDQGGDGGTFNLQFHRLSEMAASLIVAKRPTAGLRKTLGTPKIVENDVFRAYAEVLEKFGRLGEIPKAEGLSGLSISIGPEAEATSVEDSLSGTRIRGIWTGGYEEYPAAEEIIALQKKTIPDGTSFFYEVSCLDDDAGRFPNRRKCRNYNEQTVSMVFWRPLRSEDLTNYAKAIQDYNALIARYKAQLRAVGKEAGVDAISSRGLPPNLRMFQFLAGDAWPEDFIHLVGSHQPGEDGCAPGIGGWRFALTQKEIYLDVMLIENSSKRPISIDGLLGHRAATPRLRPASSSASTAAVAQVRGISGTLAAGERLLVPIKITLSPTEYDKEAFRYTETSNEILKRLGTNKFTGTPSSHRAPVIRDYVYGPELAVKGIVVNGVSVNLTRQEANFLTLALTAEVGSCPYLMSWDDAEREWIEHGKVLHRASGPDRQEIETIAMPGLRLKFRLEERETEIALIDQSELVLELRDGTTATLHPEQSSLTTQDRYGVQLLWGDSLDLTFSLPSRIVEADVVESRLTLSGYYERYSELSAEQAGRTPMNAPGRMLIGQPAEPAGWRDEFPMCVRGGGPMNQSGIVMPTSVVPDRTR